MKRNTLVDTELIDVSQCYQVLAGYGYHLAGDRHLSSKAPSCAPAVDRKIQNFYSKP